MTKGYRGGMVPLAGQADPHGQREEGCAKACLP